MLLIVLRRWSRCCSYSVWLCSFYTAGASSLKSSRASFSIVITSLGEEGAGLCASRAFVCLFVCLFCQCYFFCHFSLSFGIGGSCGL